MPSENWKESGRRSDYEGKMVLRLLGVKKKTAQRIRIDRESEANHDLIL